MTDLKAQVLFYTWILWRRRWQVLSVAWPICLVGWIAVSLIPDKYLATARIYVDTETLLAPLLKGIAVDVDLNQQIEVMQRTLLSRPNLEKVLRMADLDLAMKTDADRDRALKDLASSTAIRPQGVHNLFTVEYANHDPAVAKAVVQALLTIFVESNLGNSRRDMDQARRFLDDQIKSYEGQLAASESRLADFKLRYPDLTQGSGSVAARLDAARQHLLQIRSELEDATTRRVALRSEFARVPQFIEVDGAPQVIIDGGGRRGPTELEARILQVQKTLYDLQLRYTDQHPDVIAARRMLAELKQQLAAEGGGPSAAPDQSGITRGPTKQKIANSVYEQTQLKLIEIESDIQTLERRFAEQQQEVDKLAELSRTAPTIEAELASLNRDYGVIKRNYEELLGRRESAKLSQKLDSSSDKVEFRIVDPPVTPIAPSSPNRASLLTMVLAAGIGAGVALALLLSQIDDSFATLRKLRGAFDLRVLGNVSAVLSPADRRQAIVSTGGFLLGTGALLLAYGVIVVAVPHGTSILKLLEPVIRPVRQLI